MRDLYKKVRLIKDILRKCPGTHPLVMAFRHWKRMRWNLFRDSYRRKYSEHLFFEGKRRPIILYIETVNVCSNDCIFCAYSKMDREKAVMPLELFEKALGDYCDMGGGPVSLTPIAGDVFFDNLLLDRLSAVKKYKDITSIGFTTNAAVSDRMSDDNLRRLLTDTDMLEISIYGLSPEEYRMITRRDDFAKVTGNISRIIRISESLGAESGKITFALRFLKNRNFLEIRDFMMKEFGKKIHYEELSSVYVSYGNWAGLVDTAKPLPVEAEWKEESVQHTPCFIPLIGGQVLSDGRVTYCHCIDYDGSDEFHLGNIKEKTLSEIYDGEKSRGLWNFEDNAKTPSPCKGCTFYRPLSDLPSCEHIFDDPLDFVAG